MFDSSFLVEQSEKSDYRPYISSYTIIKNPHNNYDTTQTEQNETFQDPPDTFHDTHQIVSEFLEPIQQDQNTLTCDKTTVPDKNNTNEINTDTQIFTVTTESNNLQIPTRQIEHNTNDNVNS